jgi:hypothetical protein
LNDIDSKRRAGGLFDRISSKKGALSGFSIKNIYFLSTKRWGIKQMDPFSSDKARRFCAERNER